MYERSKVVPNNLGLDDSARKIFRTKTKLPTEVTAKGVRRPKDF